MVLVLAVDLVFGLGFKFYRFFYFDMSLHFAGGFFAAMFISYYLKDFLKRATPRPDKLKTLLVISGAVLFIGVFWEFAEYLATRFLGDFLAQRYDIVCCMGNLDDTMNDLAMDILGAITFSLALLFPSKSRTLSKYSEML